MALGLFIYAIVQIRGDSEKFLNYTPFFLAYTHGIFVIGDILILCFFWIFVDLFLLFINKLKYTFLIFLLFNLVRNAGEVIYWFNYQFALKDPHPTRNQFEWLSGPLLIDNVYILYQLTNQMFVILWLFLLYVLIKNWKKFD